MPAKVADIENLSVAGFRLRIVGHQPAANFNTPIGQNSLQSAPHAGEGRIHQQDERPPAVVQITVNLFQFQRRQRLARPGDDQ